LAPSSAKCSAQPYPTPELAPVSIAVQPSKIPIKHILLHFYIETLRIWLEEGLNDNQAVKRLFIRRNSFLYRRDRLLATLGEDINDPDVRFYLSLCIRLLQY